MIYANHEACRLFDMPLGQLVGTLPQQFGIVSTNGVGKSAPRTGAAMSTQALATGLPAAGIANLQSRTGRDFWVGAFALPLPAIGVAVIYSEIPNPLEPPIAAEEQARVHRQRRQA